MQKQIPLFITEEHRPQPQQRPQPAPTLLRGTIKRGLEQLKASHNWIQRTSDLKFKRQEAQHGDV